MAAKAVSYEGVARRAVLASFRKLDPRVQWKNPVMFVVEVGTLITLLLALDPTLFGRTGGAGRAFDAVVTAVLLVTLLFANFAEAMAEGRGQAQAQSLRRSKTDTLARRIDTEGQSIGEVPASEIKKGELVRVEAGEVIPADGEIVRGVASVDESAITGESEPVIREAGGDFSSVTGGTRVLSDWIEVRVTADPGHAFLDRMIALVEGAERQKSPNELALTVLLAALTLIFLIVLDALEPMASFLGAKIPLATLIALLVCLIPTTIGALLSAIGIAGMDRVIRFGVIAKSGRAVEAAGDIDTLILDKTGTITLGNRMATEFVPLPGVEPSDLVRAALLASLFDETPEGRSIVDLASRLGETTDKDALEGARSEPFSAETRRSGVLLPDGREITKGAVDVIARLGALAGYNTPDLERLAEGISRSGGTPLGVADGGRPLGLVHLKDIIKPGMKERFEALRRMGIHTVMVTGDNPLTAQTIAREAGVDDFIAEAKPEDKMHRIRSEQAQGRLVAMTGDGTNDAPALAQADVGLAMNSGTAAAKEAGNMVDLDSDPTKLIEVVSIGKQLLITRGAITTFSIANDVAKYFAILPAMFVSTIPSLGALNVMHLTSPQSAILSALIFNALIIPALIPLALRGVRYQPMSATKMLQRNILIYGLGGVITPFLGIKLIDLALTTLHLAHP